MTRIDRNQTLAFQYQLNNIILFWWLLPTTGLVHDNFDQSRCWAGERRRWGDRQPAEACEARQWLRVQGGHVRQGRPDSPIFLFTILYLFSPKVDVCGAKYLFLLFEKYYRLDRWRWMERMNIPSSHSSKSRCLPLLTTQKVWWRGRRTLHPEIDLKNVLAPTSWSGNQWGGPT